MPNSKAPSNFARAQFFAFWIAMATSLLVPNRKYARADTEIALDQAIAAIEATEVRVQTYVWKFHFSRHKLADKKDPSSISETLPDYMNGSFFYHIPSGRYLMELEEVSPWGGGVTPYISVREGWSFDGQVYRRWQRHRHGTALPPVDVEFEVSGAPLDPTVGPLFGTITSAQEAQGEFTRNAAGSGLFYFPPFGIPWASQDRRVPRTSEVLRQLGETGENVQVNELSNGTWRIDIPHRTIKGGRVRWIIDPARGFVVTGGEEQDASAVYRRFAVTVEQIGDALWAPTEIIDYNVLSGDADRIVITDLEVNPELTDEDFRVRFPIGTQVDDFIENKFYLVGSGAENEAQAVRDFVQRHGLGPLRDESGGGGVTWRIVVAAGALLALSCTLVYMLRRRGGASKQAAGLFAAMLVFGTHAGVASERTPSGDWIVRHSPQEEIRISQCGFNVAVLALELGERRYEPARLSKSLRPTKDGILLSDLKAAIEAHGLNVEARDHVSLDDLAERLQTSQMAIFPALLQGRIWHYFGALRQPGGELFILDPPARVLRLDEISAVTRERKVVTLFVSKLLEPQKLASCIELRPAELDLGTFQLLDGTDDVSVQVVLRNASSKPVMVNSLTKSCGCTTADWHGGMIRGRAEVALELTVHKKAWGAGPQRRDVRLLFPDGSERRIELVGEGVVDERDAGLKVSTRSFAFDVPVIGIEAPYYAAADLPIDAQRPGQSGELAITSDVPWLSGLAHTAQGQSLLRVDIGLEQGELRELFAAGRLQGALRLANNTVGSVTKLDIAVVRNRPFDVRPNMLRVKRSGTGGKMYVEVASSVEGISNWRVSRVWSEPEGVKLTAAEHRGETQAIDCAVSADTQTGTYIGRCEIEAGGPCPEVASFMVRVVE